MRLGTIYADFVMMKGIRVTADDGNNVLGFSAIENVWNCGLKCRRMKGCLSYNFNRGTKECQLLKVCIQVNICPKP